MEWDGLYLAERARRGHGCCGVVAVVFAWCSERGEREGRVKGRLLETTKDNQ